MRTEHLTPNGLIKSIDLLLDIPEGKYLFTLYVVVGQTARVSTYIDKKMVFNILSNLMNSLETELEGQEMNIEYNLEIEKLIF